MIISEHTKHGVWNVLIFSLPSFYLGNIFCSFYSRAISKDLELRNSFLFCLYSNKNIHKVFLYRRYLILFSKFLGAQHILFCFVLGRQSFYFLGDHNIYFVVVLLIYKWPCLYTVWFVLLVCTQPPFTSSKPTMETTEHILKSIQS